MLFINNILARMPAATVRQHGEKNCFIPIIFYNSPPGPLSKIREGESRLTGIDR